MNGYCAELSRIRCDHRVACGLVREQERAACEEAWRQSWPCNGLEARVNNGFADFDAEAGDRCLASARENLDDCSMPDVIVGIAQIAFLGPTACSPGPGTEPPSPPPSCGREAVPRAGHGEPCRVNDDCIAEDDACGGTGCDRTCQTPGALGGPCSKKGRCDPGLACDGMSRTCVIGQPPGAACGWEAPCDPATAQCDFQNAICMALGGEGDPCPCEPELICPLRQSSPSTCIRPPTEGEHCESQFECEAPLLCLQQKCFRQVPEGAACERDAECEGGLFCLQNVCAPRLGEALHCTGASRWCECAEGLTCDAILTTCERPTTVDEGGACTAIDSRWGTARACDDEHTCVGAALALDGGVGTSGTCEPKRLGDSCRFEFDCPHRAYCAIEGDAGVGTCTAAAEGTACQFSDHCQPEHICEQGFCRPSPTAGGSCDPFGPRRCAAGLKCVSRADGPRCVEPARPGESCDDETHGDCVFGFDCVDHRCISAGLPGTPCLTDGRCLLGACSDASGKCEDARAAGEACISDSECSSGWCDRNMCQPGCDQ